MITSFELLGQFGADVDVTPVNLTAKGSNGSEEILHTITVPAGETWLVAMVVDVQPATSLKPKLKLGDSTPFESASGLCGIAITGTGEIVASIQRTTSTSTGDKFVGHVYAVKI